MRPHKTPGHFYLHPQLSPSYYNIREGLLALNWKSTSYRWRSDFSDRNLQFDEKASENLEYKHLLAELVSRYCPQIMPLTYRVNDDNWPQVLTTLDEAFCQGKNSIPDLTWILKPSLLNNGQSIKIISTISELESHFLSTNRLGGEHVLQQYIIHPHLLRDHRKYSIRQFLILTNYAGAYLYRQGYFNVALQPYQPENFYDLASHLTNEHLHGNEPNVLQIPTDQFEWYKTLYPQIETILTKISTALKLEHPQAFKVKKHKTIALFGMDFMVDNQQKIWLLEANHGPCFPTDINHPLQPYLYQPFWQAVINGFVLPITNRTTNFPNSQDFIELGK